MRKKSSNKTEKRENRRTKTEKKSAYIARALQSLCEIHGRDENNTFFMFVYYTNYGHGYTHDTEHGKRQSSGLFLGKTNEKKINIRNRSKPTRGFIPIYLRTFLNP